MLKTAFTVFAKPPSEPKLSQLSSEEEDEVSMGTSGTLRKLLRLILVDGAWAASFFKKQHEKTMQLDGLLYLTQ